MKTQHFILQPSRRLAILVEYSTFLKYFFMSFWILFLWLVMITTNLTRGLTMKNTNFQFGYDVEVENNETFIIFDENRFEENEYIQLKMKYEDFKSMLIEKEYGVIQKESGLFHKTLRGDVSGIEYETELDALIDCYYHFMESQL